MERRHFLKISGGAVVMISLSNILPGCGSIVRSDSECYENADSLINRLGNDRMDILCNASLAPSSHNVQPWNVKILEPDKWIIGTDGERWIPAVDPDCREMMISLGTFLETLIAAAAGHGYKVSYKIIGTNAKEKDIAEVTLTKTNRVDVDFNSIKLRTTIRNGIQKNDIKSEDIKYIFGDGLESVYAGDEQVQNEIKSKTNYHYFTRQSPQGKFLGEGTLEANKYQVKRDDVQRELGKWIRWSRGDAEKFRTGLTPASLDITGFAGLFVRFFYNENTPLTSSFREKTIEKTIEQLNSYAGWILITNNSDSVEDLIFAGRKYQRMFLKVRNKNIAVHPMTQLIQEKNWKDKIAGELGVDGHVQFVVRIGYVENYPAPVSIRMPVDWFAS